MRHITSGAAPPWETPPRKKGNSARAGGRQSFIRTARGGPCQSIRMLRAAFNAACSAPAPRLLLAASRRNYTRFPSRVQPHAPAGDASAVKPPTVNAAAAPIALGRSPTETSIVPLAYSQVSPQATPSPAAVASASGDARSMNARARCPRGIIR